jgi:aminoglycoside 6'-N-acetyltransferase I
MSLSIRPAGGADTADWLRLRCALWPEQSPEEHRAEVAEFFAGGLAEPQAVWMARSATGEAVGFVELSIRAHAEGCERPNPAYVEGIYVVPEQRRSGVGRQLLAAADAWARSRGCSEIASDTAPDNTPSAGLHAAAGFQDAGLVRCWAKRL